MKQIQSRKDLKEYYFDKEVVDTYIDKRFSYPLGRLLHTKQVEVVNAAIEKYHVKNLIEFAPGPGRVSVEITGFQYGTMVDASENMLNLAQQRIQATANHDKWSFEHADIFEFTTEQQFDLVFTFRFIRHLDDEKRTQIYALIRKILSQQGLLIFDAINYHVSNPLRQKHSEEYPIYDKLYTREELIKELQGHGFDVINLSSVQCRYGVQAFLNNFTKLHLGSFAYFLMTLLEKDNSENPLEWIVLCQKR